MQHFNNVFSNQPQSSRHSQLPLHRIVSAALGISAYIAIELILEAWDVTSIAGTILTLAGTITYLIFTWTTLPVLKPQARFTTYLFVTANTIGCTIQLSAAWYLFRVLPDIGTFQQLELTANWFYAGGLFLLVIPTLRSPLFPAWFSGLQLIYAISWACAITGYLQFVPYQLILVISLTAELSFAFFLWKAVWRARTSSGRTAVPASQ